MRRSCGADRKIDPRQRRSEGRLSRGAEALKRVAVLISGRGSNLGALIAAQDASYKIVLVISNVEGAGGLDKAQRSGIATAVIPHGGKSRETFDAELDTALRAAGAELVVLAG